MQRQVDHRSWRMPSWGAVAAGVAIVVSLGGCVAPAPSLTITTFAGTGDAFCGGEGPAGEIAIQPTNVATDGVGNLYVANEGAPSTALVGCGVRKVDPAGQMTTISGTAYVSFGVAADSVGNVFFSDSYNSRVRKVDANGVVTVLAGTGAVGDTGDGDAATSATLQGPWGVAVDRFGNVYVADWGADRVRKIDTSGIITTVAGRGTSSQSSGDGGPAVDAWLNSPTGIAVDFAGNLYIAELQGNRVRKVDTSGVITTIAGTGVEGNGGDGGGAAAARLRHPVGVAVDSGGTVFIADSGNSVVRKVNGGVITRFAGAGTGGFSGDEGPPTSAELKDPEGVASDSSGTVYLVDRGNDRVRKVAPRGATTGAPSARGPLVPG